MRWIGKQYTIKKAFKDTPKLVHVLAVWGTFQLFYWNGFKFCYIWPELVHTTATKQYSSRVIYHFVGSWSVKSDFQIDLIQGLTVFFHYYFFSPYKRGSSVTPSSSPLKKSGGSPAQKKGIRQDLRNAFGRPGQDEDETEESEEDDENQKSKKVTYFFPIQFFFQS